MPIGNMENETYNNGKGKQRGCCGCIKNCLYSDRFQGNFVLTMLVIGYMCFGSAVFMKIEDGENSINRTVLISNISNDLWDDGITMSFDDWYSKVNNTLEEYLFHNRCSDIIYDNPMRHFSFMTALFLCMTAITTIGYGTVTPRSMEGRLFLTFYSIIGIPLFLMFVSNFGVVVAATARDSFKGVRKVARKTSRRVSRTLHDHRRAKVSIQRRHNATRRKGIDHTNRNDGVIEMMETERSQRLVDGLLEEENRRRNSLLSYGIHNPLDSNTDVIETGTTGSNDGLVNQINGDSRVAIQTNQCNTSLEDNVTRNPIVKTQVKKIDYGCQSSAVANDETNALNDDIKHETTESGSTHINDSSEFGCENNSNNRTANSKIENESSVCHVVESKDMVSKPLDKAIPTENRQSEVCPSNESETHNSTCLPESRENTEVSLRESHNSFINSKCDGMNPEVVGIKEFGMCTHDELNTKDTNNSDGMNPEIVEINEFGICTNDEVNAKDKNTSDKSDIHQMNKCGSNTFERTSNDGMPPDKSCSSTEDIRLTSTAIPAKRDSSGKEMDGSSHIYLNHKHKDTSVRHCKQNDVRNNTRHIATEEDMFVTCQNCGFKVSYRRQNNAKKISFQLDPAELEHAPSTVHDNIHRRPSQSSSEIVNPINPSHDKALSVLAVTYILYTLGGAWLFVVWEERHEWSYVDAFYFCVTTLTTIGFGDLMLDLSDPEQPHRIIVYKSLLFMIYAFVGLILLSACFSLAQEKIKSVAASLFKSLGITQCWSAFPGNCLNLGCCCCCRTKPRDNETPHEKEENVTGNYVDDVV